MTAHAVVDSANTSRSYALSGPLGSDINLEAEGGGPCRALRVGSVGDLAIVNADGSSNVIPAMLAGETIHVQAIQVLAAGTTAQKITVLW